MKIKLDENLPAGLASILAQLGQETDTVPDEGLAGSDDPQVWEAAQRARRFLITQDLDFSDVRKFVPGTHRGILLIDNMVKTIVQEINPKQVYLFGPVARGEVHADSDIDLLIAESEPFDDKRSRREELKRIRHALFSYSAPKDILVYSRDEVRKWQNSINHIIGRCLREGRLLYERH